MMKFIAIAAVALCAVAVFAQHPRHCNAPSEFEAHAFQMDPKEQFFRRGRFAYDSREERVALLEDVVNGTDQEYFHTIHLWRERTTYRINLKTKTCTTEELRHRFHRIEIPRDAHFVGEAIIGTNAFENSGLLTTHWNAENKTEKWDWYGVFTDRDIGCVPVADEFHDHEVGRVNTQYFDVVLGIADPNVFIPPESCKRSDDNNNAEPVIDIKKETAGDSYTFAHGVAPKKSDAVNAKAGSWALFKQCDPSWANVQLGTCSLTICQAGCAMSSTAMILRTKGIDTNPDVLNSWLKSNGGYESGCDIVWSAVDRFGKTSFQGIEHADYATICSGISAGHGIIGNVRGGTHWVLLTGCDGKNNFYVNDPGFPSTMYSYGDVLQEAVYH